MTVDKNQLVTAVVFKKKLDAFIKEHKQDWELVHAPGDAESVKFDLGGQPLTLGKMVMTDPRFAWKVTDPAALAEWAEKNSPNLGSMRFVLDDDAVKELLKQVTAQNIACTPDGELIPGIEWTTAGESYARITPDKGVDDALRLIAAEGRLSELTGLPLGLEQ